MFRILSITLIIVVSSFHTSASPKPNFNENDLDLDFSELNSNNYFEDELKLFKPIDPNIEEDAKLATPNLIRKYGYTVEVHHVTTEDGYKLELHRITDGPNSPPRKGKKACLTVHGILDSSATYVLTGPNHGLGYLLSDNDFDVWLLNTRGNRHSTDHISYKPFGSFFDRNRFWSFSWHEIGYYDLPATIDYILAQTNQSTLHYVGHSQGATAFFVMLSEKPEYNEKIDMMQALAPAVFMTHVTSPAVRAIAPILPLVQRVKALLGVHFFQPNKQFLIMAGKLLCRDHVPTQAICENFLFLLLGYNTDQLNSTILPVIFGHVPAGCSANQLSHFGQGVNSGRFRQYDYGFPQNWFKYKHLSPPEYNLKNVRVPVAVYYSKNDWMAGPKDIHTLLQRLPYVIKSYLVPHKEFNHIDFMWGIDAPILLYDEVIKTIKSSSTYSNQKSNGVEQITNILL